MGIVVCVEAWISLGHSLKLVRTPGCLHQLLRNFRSSFTLMPLLAKSLGELGIGTWSNIATVSTSTLLTDALNMLKTYSCLPVIDEEGLLVDIYTRTDIISLAKSNAYSRLQFEEVTVMQALSLSNMANPGMFGSGSQFGGMSPANMSPPGVLCGLQCAKEPCANQRMSRQGRFEIYLSENDEAWGPSAARCGPRLEKVAGYRHNQRCL